MFAVAFLISSAENSGEAEGVAEGKDSLDLDAEEVTELDLELPPPAAPPITPRTKSPIGITNRFLLYQGLGVVLPVNGRSSDMTIPFAYVFILAQSSGL
jgi:hypothetical protein